MTIQFNINHNVQVRLTNHGRSCHRQNFDRLASHYNNFPLAYEAPKEDAEGWSTWQAHELMMQFGPHISASKLPFETDIRIVFPG